MTIEEINNLTVEDVRSKLIARLDSEEITEENLVTELDLYKSELIEIEHERLRIKALEDRLDALEDVNLVHSILRPQIPNAALFIKKNILENSNHEEAEANIAALEAKDAELKAAKNAEAYKELRQAEYPSIEECIHAILDGNLEEIQTKRAAVKAKYPKPE